ncbi:unnamed protein product, partial [Allacma fusca]
MTPDPTEVPNVLATSFAPTPAAKMKAMMKPTINIHKTPSWNSPKSQNEVDD